MVQIRCGRSTARFLDDVRRWASSDTALAASLNQLTSRVPNSPSIPRYDLAVAEVITRAMDAEILWISWSPPDRETRVY